jgi:hypothetical protein
MCEIEVSGCQFPPWEWVKAQSAVLEVKPVIILGFSKTYSGSSRLMDEWRSVSPKTSHVIAIRKMETPRIVPHRVIASVHITLLLLCGEQKRHNPIE